MRTLPALTAYAGSMLLLLAAGPESPPPDVPWRRDPSAGPTSQGPTSQGPTSQGPTSQGPTSRNPAPPVHTKHTWIDPAKAKLEDPDFALQGEYANDDGGLQLVALGGGEFRVVRYPDGLPGLGWNRSKPEVLRLGIGPVRQLVAAGQQRIERSSTTLGMPAPEGATVLFDGSAAAMANWKQGARRTEDGLLMEGATSLPQFGDARIHVEFRLPYKPRARGQARGNSGLYVQARYETQMLDSFGLEGEHNECGGIYSVRKPDLNVCLPPLRWQTYDIDFTAARFDADGKKRAPARMTVRLNGVVIHADVPVPKRTTASPRTEGPTPGPIYLQDHGNPVRYRNIWVLPEPPKRPSSRDDARDR